MQRLSLARHLVWVGIALMMLSIGGLYQAGNMVDETATTGQPQFFGFSRQQMSNASLVAFLTGGALLGLGLWARTRHKRMLIDIQELIQGREIWVMRQMEAGSGGQIAVRRLFKLAFQLKEANEYVDSLR